MIEEEKNTDLYRKFELPEISDSLFKSFSDLIYSLCGIYLPLRKKMMLISRLLKRLSILNISTFQEYYDYLLSSEGREEEIIKMINAVTTNKTEFFRDQQQFQYLTTEILPVLVKEKKLSGSNKLNIWSAGCSTGEEPYTIAIVLAEFCDNNNLERSFLITGSDISTRVLDQAGNGIYKRDVIEHLPKSFLHKYFNKYYNNKKEEEYHITDELKKYVKILRLNLMDNEFGFKTPKDIIFCRNVIIYFDKQIQITLYNKFYNCLKSGGYMFIGNSESLFSITDKFRMIAPSIYLKAD